MSSSTSISEAKRTAWWLLGAAASALVVAILLEGLLRLLPAGSDLHRENPERPLSSARLVRNLEYTFSMGWDFRHVVRGRTNSMGFISPHEYRKEDRAIALIGDSFAEGEMLSYEDSLAGHLDARAAGAFRTFNFGLSGAALPHYLGIAREMGPQFHFGGAVVIVGPGDYSEGFEEKEGQYRWGKRAGEDDIALVPAASRSELKQLARSSALMRYLRGNLKFSPAALFESAGHARCLPVRLAEADLLRLGRYVDALPSALGLAPGRIVMVFNGNTREVYERVDRAQTGERQAPCPTIDSLALAELRVLAEQRGMQVLEVVPLLEGHYREYRRPLDFRPVDPHWNGLATSIIAAEVARRLDIGKSRLF
ncbi:MAG TPA: hypothetical protein VM140_13035 [Burkholderiales bacterium]|nr:hypothetical protein [Burkholderiales bacterium]